MRRSRTDKMVTISLLAAIAYLLMLLEFPVLPTFPWLRVDFSDIPILIGTFLYGPSGGVITAFIRSTLKFITSGGDIGSLIGNTVGFLASVIFLLPTYALMKKQESTRHLVIGLGISSVLLTLFMAVANYFVITPLYLYVLGMDFGMPIAEMVLFGVVPFNLIKGVLVSLVFVVVYKKLMPILLKRKAISK